VSARKAARAQRKGDPTPIDVDAAPSSPKPTLTDRIEDAHLAHRDRLERDCDRLLAEVARLQSRLDEALPELARLRERLDDASADRWIVSACIAGGGLAVSASTSNQFNPVTQAVLLWVGVAVLAIGLVVQRKRG
jgi:hypothetical protein